MKIQLDSKIKYRREKNNVTIKKEKQAMVYCSSLLFMWDLSWNGLQIITVPGAWNEHCIYFCKSHTFPQTMYPYCFVMLLVLKLQLLLQLSRSLLENNWNGRYRLRWFEWRKDGKWKCTCIQSNKIRRMSFNSLRSMHVWWCTLH